MAKRPATKSTMTKTSAKKPASKPASSAADTKDASDKAYHEQVEWIVAGISALVVIALAGYIGFEAAMHTGGNPDIAVRIDTIYQMEAGYGVDVTVLNSGDATIAEVEIEAVSGTETSSFTLDYLPAFSEAEAGFGFVSQPDPETVSVRVVGFIFP